MELRDENGSTFTPDKLKHFGEIIPHLHPIWDDLPENQRRIWLFLARRTLPQLKRLFEPRFISVGYHSAYEAVIALDGVVIGPVNLFQGTSRE